jgi:tetratricopeptide (TPR) repeat protein
VAGRSTDDYFNSPKQGGDEDDKDDEDDGGGGGDSGSFPARRAFGSPKAMLLKRESGQRSMECAICLELLSGSRLVAPARVVDKVLLSTNAVVRRLTCGHELHEKCLVEYIMREGERCPLCRAQLRDPKDLCCAAVCLCAMSRSKSVPEAHMMYARAESLLRRSIEVDPLQWDCQLQLGSILQHNENLEGAMLCYEAAIALNPELYLAIARIASIKSMNGDQVSALETFLRATALVPPRILAPGAANTTDLGIQNDIMAASQTYQLLGEFYCRHGTEEQAFTAYSQAAAIDPRNSGPDKQIGMLHMDMSQYDKVGRQQFDNLAFAQTPLTTYTGLCACFFPPQAITALRRSLAIEPHQADALHAMADALYCKGDYTESIPLLERSLNLDPDCADGWESLGNALNRKRVAMLTNGGMQMTLEIAEVYTRARECWERAISVEPRDRVDCHFNIGAFHQGLGEDALAAHRAALATPRDAINHHGPTLEAARIQLESLSVSAGTGSAGAGGGAQRSSRGALASSDRSSVCAHCGDRGTKLRCARCRVVKYCGNACQRAHWRAGHRQECIQPAVTSTSQDSTLHGEKFKL